MWIWALGMTVNSILFSTSPHSSCRTFCNNLTIYCILLYFTDAKIAKTNNKNNNDNNIKSSNGVFHYVCFTYVCFISFCLCLRSAELKAQSPCQRELLTPTDGLFFTVRTNCLCMDFQKKNQEIFG